MSVPTLSQEPLEVPRLRVEDLTIASTRGVEILQDVSLDVIAGEVLGLVGESGSGKTTLALAMIGYVRRGLRFAGGSVRLDGRDLLTLARAGAPEAAWVRHSRTSPRIPRPH